MLIITCPFCGPRSESEYIHGGPSKARRPEKPSEYADAEWVNYLTVPANPVGPVSEKWWHVRGCGQWVTIERDTLTHAITPEQKDGLKDAEAQPVSQTSDKKNAD